MLSFMGQGQLGKLGKLATFVCEKRISENPKYVFRMQSHLVTGLKKKTKLTLNLFAKCVTLLETRQGQDIE